MSAHVHWTQFQSNLDEPLDVRHVPRDEREKCDLDERIGDNVPIVAEFVGQTGLNPPNQCVIDVVPVKLLDNVLASEGKGKKEKS